MSTTKTSMEIFTATSSIITKRWKQPKYSSTGEWIKMSYIHRIEYFSTTKRNDVLPHTRTCMKLTNINLSEKSLLQKTIYYMI